MKKKEVKDRIKALEIAIETINHRYVQIMDLNRSATCDLCKEYAQTKLSCLACPANRNHKPLFGCDDFGIALQLLKRQLIRQRTEWQNELTILQAGTKK